MKILHCGNYDFLKYGKNFYCPDYKIHNGLVRNGWYVYPFSYRDEARKNLFRTKKLGIGKANENLKNVAKNIKPDILLLGHSEIIDTNTLQWIKQKLDIPIVMWWVDSFDEEKVAHIRERIDFLDAFFSTTDAMYVQKRLNVSKTNIFYFPNICDSSIDTLKNFERNNLQGKLLYIGRIYEEKREFFNKLSNKKISWEHYTNIYGAQFYEILSKYYFGLNFSKYNNIPKYSSDRIIYLTANGLTVFCPRIPEFSSIFDDNEVIYFNDVEELRELYFKAIKDQNWAKKIARNGWLRAHSDYDAKKVMYWLITTSLEIGCTR